MTDWKTLQARIAALPAGESLCVAQLGCAGDFIAVWRYFVAHAPATASLDFVSIQPVAEAETLFWLEQGDDAESRALQACWQRRVPGWNRWHFAAGRVRLTLILDEPARALAQLPAGSVDMWLSDEKGQMASLGTSPALLRQDGGRAHRPATAIVIGGGVAGCAAAYSLAQRGVVVTLVERAPVLAHGASGNPVGILHARFGAGNIPLHRFVLAAYGHALALLDTVMPVDGELRAECGLLQLACNENEQKRIARLAAQDWPPHVLQAVDVEGASRLAGVEMRYGGLWFPAGGWLVPPQFCEALANQAGVTRQLGHEVEHLQRVAGGWRVSGRDVAEGAWQTEVESVLVCCAHTATQLSPLAHLPLMPVRGQITRFKAQVESHALRTVVCGEGYCTPAVDEQHVCGATHAFEDVSIEVRANEHAQNLARLADYAPALGVAASEAEPASLNGRAAIRCSAPGSLPLVGEVQAGLYCSLAHGTRGLLTAGIAAEVLAAGMMGTFPPLPVDILTALAPSSRMKKKGQAAP